MRNRSPQSMHYDMQNNTYYRLDKSTGQKVTSYINGQNMPTFKPDITGIEYKSRRKSLDKNDEYAGKQHYSYHHNQNSYKHRENNTEILPKKQNPQKINANLRNSHVRSISIDQKYGSLNRNNYKTLDFYNTSPNSGRKQALTISLSRNNSKNKNLLSSDMSRSRNSFNQTMTQTQMGTSNNFYIMKTPQLTASPLRNSLFEADNSDKKNNDFSQSVKKFATLTESKIHDNHSPKREIDGSVQRKNKLQTLCVTRTNFRNQDEPQKGYEKDKSSSVINKFLQNRKLILPETLHTENQVRKDKNLFYQLRPDLVFHENYKSLQKQKDRKVNLIKLEKLTISQNNKKTKHIVKPKIEL